MMLYLQVVEHLLKTGALKHHPKVLVFCAGELDQHIWSSKHVANVSFSNLNSDSSNVVDKRTLAIDVEDICHPDNSFDICVVHKGLHHCASPHKALTELYRVAKEKVVVIENPDNLFMRALIALDYAQNYELSAVRNNCNQAGGWRDTNLPNYVYRWTEREVNKTILTFDPACPPSIQFMYGLAVPTRVYTSNSVFKKLAAMSLELMASLTKNWGAISNEMAFIVDKARARNMPFDWIERDETGKFRLSSTYEVDPSKG